jgi:MOSC domain-containing protein YiiM
MGRLVSLNVGLPKVIGLHRGQPILSGIDKHSTTDRLRVAGVNIAGDDQADRKVHGGPDKAIYAYALEDLQWWAGELDRELAPGVFGENLTTEGIDCTGAVIGERWQVGDVLLEVCQPRLPCFKLGLQFDDTKMLKRFAQASRPGAYLRIITEGELGAGEPIDVFGRPDHGVTTQLVADAFLKDRTLAATALLAPELAVSLREQLS